MTMYDSREAVVSYGACEACPFHLTVTGSQRVESD